MTILKTKIGVAFFVFFSSLVMYMLLAIIGGYISLDLKLVTGCLGYFISLYWILSKEEFPNKLFAFILVAWFPFFVFVYFNIIQFKNTWVSFGASLFICLGAIGGSLYYKSRSIWIPVALALSILLWLAVIKNPFHNKIVYGTYNGTVLFHQPVISLYDNSSNVYNLNNPHKLYIIDFWTSSCGVCFRNFPMVDSISKQADKSKFEIIALNIPIQNEKKEENFRILSSYPYTFKKLFAEAQSVADSFGVNAYPTTIVIKGNKVIFRGDFEDAVERYGVSK